MNRLEDIINSDHKSEDDLIMLLDFQKAARLHVEHGPQHSGYKTLKASLYEQYQCDDVQYGHWLRTAIAYNHRK